MLIFLASNLEVSLKCNEPVFLRLYQTIYHTRLTNSEKTFLFWLDLVFSYYFELREVTSILAHWPRPEEDWR